MSNRISSLFRNLFRKRAVEQALDDELRSSVEVLTQEKMKDGVSPSIARREALIELGGVEQVKEQTREVRAGHFLETLWQDIRFAFRILSKTPLITGIALLSLALGIGANTAIFSLIDAVMLRMLPVRDPQQLVQIEMRDAWSRQPQAHVTNPIWEQVRDHQDVFAGAFAWFSVSFDLAAGGQVNPIQGVYASGSYFNVLGVHPAAGRLFTSADDIRGCSGVAVLGYGFWQSRYAGAQSAIGSFIRLNGHEFPIVGVAQRGFTGTDVGTPLDVAIPLCAEAIVPFANKSLLDNRSAWWLRMMGRLKPGMTINQADARIKVLSKPLFASVVPSWTAKRQDLFRESTFMLFPASTGTGGTVFSDVRERYSQPLEVLMVVVSLVLLIACANIASLLLARSAARQKEIAVRLSLGASRGRLIRQVLTESLVLSGTGAILGVFFARWGTAFLVRFASRAHNQIFLNLRMDGRVLGFTIGVAFLSGLLFGVLPAFRATRVSAMSAMNEGQAHSAGGRSQSATARWIIAAQIALSLILLIGTGLFIHTFTNLMTLDPGFDPNNVLLVATNIHNAQIPEEARTALYARMLAKLQAVPGVVSASQCAIRPLSNMEWTDDVKVPGYEPPLGAEPEIYLNWVTPGYFATMQTSVFAGRTLDSRDSADSTPVAVINQLLARTYFRGQNPIGKHLLFNEKGTLSLQPIEIIGVVQNAKYDSLDQDFQPTAYFPLAQIGSVGEDSAFEIRTSVKPASLIPVVRDALASINKLASLQFTTLKQQADDSVVEQRILAVLSGFFAGLALLLIAIGLYGVMAYVVALRTHEIGIRMALGAQQNSILHLVLRDAFIVLAAGIAAGLLGSIWITRLVQQLLFGVKPIDPWSIALAVVAIVMVAFVATYVPARRAMKVDPMVALRYE